jgi:phosphodiesterase/alkaline phosphatase D-like protein
VGPVEHATATATGLQPNKRYYYRVLASNATGPAKKLVSVARFTSSSVPGATTTTADGFTPTSVTLAGEVDPDGLATSYYFQYGGTSSYGHQTPPAPAGQGTTPAPYSTLLEGLEPGRTYHYRIVAENENHGTRQTGYGQDETFTMPSTPPTLTGATITAITQNTATITATLNPQGLPTRYELQAGPTPTLLTPQTSGDTTSTTPAPIALPLNGLAPATVYYYTLTATNPDGNTKTEGAFTTAPAPAAAAPPPALTIVPFSTIAELDAKEAKENKPPKPLTNHEKLVKALKACKKDKNKHKRNTCEKQAHQKYGPKKKNKN